MTNELEARWKEQMGCWTREVGQWNVLTCLARFTADAVGLLELLERTGSFVAGGLPTQFLAGETWAESDMDVYTTRGYAEEVRMFWERQGFDERVTEEEYVGEFEVRTLANARGRVVQLVVMCTPTRVEVVLSRFYSTVVMNAITGTHVVSLFPRLTFVEKAMIGVGQGTQREVAGVEKYRRRGWKHLLDDTGRLMNRMSTESGLVRCSVVGYGEVGFEFQTVMALGVTRAGALVEPATPRYCMPRVGGKVHVPLPCGRRCRCVWLTQRADVEVGGYVVLEDRRDGTADGEAVGCWWSRDE